MRGTLWFHRVAHLALYTAIFVIVYMGIGYTSGEEMAYPVLGLGAASLLAFFLYAASFYDSKGGQGDLR